MQTEPHFFPFAYCSPLLGQLGCHVKNDSYPSNIQSFCTMLSIPRLRISAVRYCYLVSSSRSASSWVDRLKPYAQLGRLDKPIGTMLLFFPCAWVSPPQAASLDTLLGSVSRRSYGAVPQPVFMCLLCHRSSGDAVGWVYHQ